jgi:Polyketide cyclase / dehydrase and lipid transport
MWSSTYEQKVTGVTRQRVWDVWTDVDRWSSWQDDVEYAHLEGSFSTGSVIRFKPKGGPKVRIELTDVRAPSRFVDVTRFPLARMVDAHELVETAEGLEIRNTLSMEGLLAFVWRKLVGEGVAKSLPEQTARLVDQARRA